MPARTWSENWLAQVMFWGELLLGRVPSHNDGASSTVAAASKAAGTERRDIDTSIAARSRRRTANRAPWPRRACQVMPSPSSIAPQRRTAQKARDVVDDADVRT